MNTLSRLLTRLFEKFAKVPIPGTITAIGGDRALYPTFIGNEGLGGFHVYDTLEELAWVPVARLQKGMPATVNQHVRPDGSIFKKTIFYLENLPSMDFDYIADIPGYDISQYWKVDLVSPDFELAEEVQYAPNCDLISGSATVDGSGGQPPFPGSSKGKKITKADYDALHLSAGEVILSDGSIVVGYWSNEYDSTMQHKWMRSRLGSTSDWSIPIKVDGEGYESGDYIENRFKWDVVQPLTPPMQINGRLNNEPAGWNDEPGAVVPNSKLWMIKAQKTVYQQLKSPWMPPIEIKLDPQLTRYSERAVPNPNELAYADLEANGWDVMLDSGRHRFMANRANVDSAWVVTQLGGESGEYTDYVFKAFKTSLIDQILDNPNTYRPIGVTPSGWSDTPEQVATDEMLFVSSAKKFFNGELKNSPGWSDPIPFSGRDSVIDFIKSSGGDEFKKDKNGVVTPDSLTLTAYLFKGVTQITPTSIAWTKIYDGGVLIDEDGNVITDNAPISTTDTLVITPADVHGKAIFKCVQKYDNLDYIQEYSILDIADGFDANSLVLTSNAQIITRMNAGGYMPSNVTLRALSSNLSDEGLFTWFYRQNQEDTWIQIMDGALPYRGDSLSVDYGVFASDSEVHYKVESVDEDNNGPMFDTYTLYVLPEATGSNGAPATLMILSNEAHTVVQDEATGTTSFVGASTNVKIYEGSTDVTGLWTFTRSNTNVTSTINVTNPAIPVITVTGMTLGATAGHVTITATNGTQTISKQFSITRIKDPVGAVILDIDSDRDGFTFTPVNQLAKNLTANLYVDGYAVTTGVAYQWSFDGLNKGTSKVQQITTTDVEFSTTVRCVATYNGRTVARTVNITDVKDSKGIGILYSNQDLAFTASHKPAAGVAYNATSASSTFSGITATWTNNSTGAFWMVTRREGDATWSNPIRIKGEKGTQGSTGNYIKNIFKRSEFQPVTPTGDPIPATWFDTPPNPTSNPREKLWVSYGEVTNGQTETLTDDKIVGAWSVPVQIEGKDGRDAVDGAPGSPGRSVAVYVQSNTPTGTIYPGDIWIIG